MIHFCLKTSSVKFAYSVLLSKSKGEGGWGLLPPCPLCPCLNWNVYDERELRQDILAYLASSHEQKNVHPHEFGGNPYKMSGYRALWQVWWTDQDISDTWSLLNTADWWPFCNFFSKINQLWLRWQTLKNVQILCTRNSCSATLHIFNQVILGYPCMVCGCPPKSLKFAWRLLQKYDAEA